VGVLNLFRKKSKVETAVHMECAHAVLSPRWDSVADIGHEDRAIGYACTACGKQLSLEEAAEVRRRIMETVEHLKQ
jgi:hypothetical protein